MNLFKRLVILTGLLLTPAIPVSVPAQTIGNGNDGTILREIIIFGRHGIRAPTSAPSALDQYSANTYSVFKDRLGNTITTGYLTPNGQAAAELLGAYFNAYLTYEGLMTGDPQTDLAHTYFRANSIQRSNVTADKFGVGLIYGASPPSNATVPVHSFMLATANTPAVPDSVFDPLLAGKVTPLNPNDVNRAVMQARAIYGGAPTAPTALSSAYSGELALLSGVLYSPPAQPSGSPCSPGSPCPPGSVDPTTQSITLTASAPLPPPQQPNTYVTGNVINVSGLYSMTTANDPFVMQYADGFPIGDGKTFDQTEVAWGLLTPDTLSQQTRLNALQINIAMRTPFLAQAQSSNAASHVLRTLEQPVMGGNIPGKSGGNIPGKFGNAESRVHVIISSDYYVAGLAGLLNVHWMLPGYQPDFVGPGGALVFELRQVKKTGAYIVRVFYTGQTFDQLRDLSTPLTLDNPPATLQLMVPGGSQSAANLDVGFYTFRELLTHAIGQRYVQNQALEVPPGVLNGVPGE